MTMGLLISAMLIGTIGLGLFMYGKRITDVPCLGCGVALMVFPYFIHSVALMWIIAAACGGGLYAVRRVGASGVP